MGSLYRTLSLRYWRRRWTRALLVVASIALGVATWVATGILNQTLQRACRRAATPVAGAADFFISNGDVGVPRDLAVELAGVDGIRAAVPLVIQRGVLPDLANEPMLLLGLDLAARPIDQPGWCVQIHQLTSADLMRAMLLGQKPALVGRELDQRLPPDSPYLNVLVAGQVQRVRRAGTIEGQGPAATLAGSVLVMDCDTAAALTGRPDHVSRIDLSLLSGTDHDTVRHRLEVMLAGRAQVSTPDNHDQRVQEMLIGLRIGFSLCGAGALLVGLFLIFNTLAFSVAERRRDIGILRCLGATRRQVACLFLGEAGLLGAGGTMFGLCLGVTLAQGCLQPVQEILSDLFLPLRSGQIDVSGGELIGAMVAGLVTTLLAALLPALQAAAEQTIDAMRCGPPGAGRPRRKLQAMGSLALTALGAGCLVVSDRLPPRVGTLGSLVLMLLAVLIAMPLLTTCLAHLVQQVIRWLPGITSQLAVGNLIRAPGRTGVVIAALAAGVALLVQTGGMILSNEDAVRGWVDRCIAGDLFVTSGGPLTASGQLQPMTDVLAQRLAEAIPELHVVPMRMRYLDWRQPGHHARVLLLALDAPAYCAANEGRSVPLPDLDLYHQLCQPGTALVSENFAALHQISVGDRITLPGADGPVDLDVIGTVTDYSCSRGTVLVDRTRYRRQFDADLIDVLDVYLPTDADPAVVQDRIQHMPWAAVRSLCVLTRSEVRRHILGMVGRLYGLAYAQEVIVGIVALLGVVTVQLISVVQRRRELGLLRSLGATRVQIMWTVVAEAILIGGMGTVIGLVIGTALEWYTVRILLPEESGFLCPVHFPWLAASTIVVLTLMSAAAAALGPALLAVRGTITAAVAYE